jgi:hypothetical protein
MSIFKFRKPLWLALTLESRCFCDPSAACLLKEKNSLTLKQLFFFNARLRGMCPRKTAKCLVVSTQGLITDTCES